MMNNRLLKRVFDLVVAVPSTIVLSPVFILIGFMVRMRIGSPVLFRQERPGLHGRPFVIYKFRTMTDKWDKDGDLLPDMERLTPLGRFLWKTSIDPQIMRNKISRIDGSGIGIDIEGD